MDQVRAEVAHRRPRRERVRPHLDHPRVRPRPVRSAATTAPARRGRGSRRRAPAAAPDRAPPPSDAPVGTASASAQYWQTGIPQPSASAASAAKPSALPAPCWAKITGCSALGEDARRLGDLLRAGPRHRRRHQRRRVEPLGRRRLAEHLARQADVDRAARRRVGDRVRPVDDLRAPARGSAARSPTCRPRAPAPSGRASPGPSRSAPSGRRSGPCSVVGVRPENSRIGTRSTAALIAPIAQLARPTLVCAITAWPRPVAR